MAPGAVTPHADERVLSNSPLPRPRTGQDAQVQPVSQGASHVSGFVTGCVRRPTVRSVGAPRYDAAEVASALGVASVEFLGAGAFGDTWQVGDAAVKVLCVEGYPQDRVDREVDGLRRVDSPHVVRLLATGSVELGGKPRTTLTFEYVAGGDLADRMDAAERPDPDQARALLTGLLMGVRDMHEAESTVHRDIKPQNVALRDSDWAQPVLLDLGLARAVTEPTLTLYPQRLGTAAYMAPEQMRGQRARKASDLFSLGVTVRHVAGGEHPFYDLAQPATWDELIAATQQPPRPPPPGLDPEVVQVLDVLVSHAQHDRGSAASALRRLARP